MQKNYMLPLLPLGLAMQHPGAPWAYLQTPSLANEGLRPLFSWAQAPKSEQIKRIAVYPINLTYSCYRFSVKSKVLVSLNNAWSSFDF